VGAPATGHIVLADGKEAVSEEVERSHQSSVSVASRGTKKAVNDQLSAVSEDVGRSPQSSVVATDQQVRESEILTVQQHLGAGRSFHILKLEQRIIHQRFRQERSAPFALQAQQSFIY